MSTRNSSRVFKKKKNVPNVMITNRLPYSAENHGPFRARFFRLLFSSNIPNLSEARIVATLWGCMMRRICQSPYARMEVTPRWVNLDYNNIVGLIRMEFKGKELSRQSKYISYHRGLNKRDWRGKTKQNWEREDKRMEGIFFTKTLTQ